MKILFIIFGTLFFMISPVLASEFVLDTPTYEMSYVFRLYYDNGQLFADRDSEFKYDVVSERFVPEVVNTQFPFKGEIITFNNQIADNFVFDPRQGNPQFLKGTLSVKAPYAPDGQKVNFYDGQGKQLLSIFVSESSFCNDDGVCNSNVGEDIKTCPSDCKTTTSVPVISTEPSAGDLGGMKKIIIYFIIGIGLVSGGWYGGSAIWRRWKGNPSTQ
ncbi:MAG: hypothetical protein A2915_04260 [Candidatus Yanofskybacteria bacterium RIFCSPLOWO2_01_FULL_41_34]|uniref:Uncharacterized protein n=1 Tax=Candidatus Yanofskybacteria bacterium RIFCSPHIGHO2_01_FULL_41_26 TaxID=1802661 RepID=A0A1F8EDW8_9BACT|nr:MAG: hypothetical protein A2649_03360 [Candidatus Yanofskybacteria bacterium RIFCSPHIGHO2_01_FULL_41_26]OGN21618.1 MAG: hypothetical protein A2915_04260 [Candidatus Yanofskybacteria bacterium RIFCSPLOWO2_01_FULL_41_34]